MTRLDFFGIKAIQDLILAFSSKISIENSPTTRFLRQALCGFWFTSGMAALTTITIYIYIYIFFFLSGRSNKCLKEGLNV